MLRLIVATMALLAATGVAAVGYGLQAATAGDGGPGGTGPDYALTVDIAIRHSRFEPEVIRVPEGAAVRFVVRNLDPIRHEFIVGPEEVHLRHASGKEGYHPPVPGEVTVDPHTVAETVYRFDQRGSLEFACHLPAHYGYGMSGQIVVTPR